MNWPKTPEGWRYDEATGEFKADLSHQGVRVGEVALSAKLMRELLASRGWRVVSAEEKDILGDLRVIPESALQSWRVNGSIWLSNVAVSELARRATSQSGDQIAPDTAEPAEKQLDSR